MTKKYVWSAVLISLFVCCFGIAQADDTCVFTMGDSVDPNIVVLLDNGAEMEQIIWHDDYDNSTVYSPPDGVEPFDNSYGYVVIKDNPNSYLLLPIHADLSFDNKGEPTASSSTNTFEFNGRSIALPYAPSTVVVDEVIDNATQFRYSGNYLRWLFYGSYEGCYTVVNDVDDVTDDVRVCDGAGTEVAPYGSDLPVQTRFYFAKQAIMGMAKKAAHNAIIAIYNFANDDGATSVQPLGYVADDSGVLDSSFVNVINNMHTVDASPLAEGLTTIGNYYDSNSSGLDEVSTYCQSLFILVVSAGKSSADLDLGNQSLPVDFLDYDGDSGTPDGSTDGAVLPLDTGDLDIPINLYGSTWMDDVAYYMATHDMVYYQDGDQHVNTYTVGFMAEPGSDAYLINTSNNGNGNLNLYDTSHPDYGKYHFSASSSEGLAAALLDALNAILGNANTYTAPVVPITRTSSGNHIYLSFFTPSSESTFWAGNVVKYGLNDDLAIVDEYGNPATEANGALIPEAVPYWQTKDWADDSPSDTDRPDNSFLDTGRRVYTYLGAESDLTDTVNLFSTTNFDDDDADNSVDNGGISAATLGLDDADFASAADADIYAKQIINYVNGLDIYDEDEDGFFDDYRSLVTGSVLHSEPLVYEYIHSSGSIAVSNVTGTFSSGERIVGSRGGVAYYDSSGSTPLAYTDLISPFVDGETITGTISAATADVDGAPFPIFVFYGANDGMLHAVSDTDGSEAWGFIFPDQLPRLKLMLESLGHEYYVDSTPKIYLYDRNNNGFIDIVDGDAVNSDQVILVCGERKGGSSYIALDVTDPETPKFLWRKDSSDYPNLGESWSEPRFGKVKTFDDDTVGTHVVIFGGGYGYTNDDSVEHKGNAVFVLDILDGSVVRIFKNGEGLISGMDYGIPSSVRVLDVDNNGFADKLYVGDMGGQLWRIGRFDVDELDNTIYFPQANENINDWQGQVLFSAGCNEADCTNSVDDNGDGLTDERRQFFYPPTVVLDVPSDYVFITSGDRENPCNRGTQDEVYMIKDNHSLLPVSTAWTRTDLSDVTDSSLPDVDDYGWYLSLDAGEKVLAEGVVFGSVYFFTTYTPNDDPCLPGGLAKIYGVDYRSAQAVVDMDGNSDGLERSVVIGGGIPSKPVIIVRDGEAEMLVSVGSTNPDAGEDNFGAGIFSPPVLPDFPRLILQWWKEEN